jgi:prepilin-type processing-associated H-X9-DG protein
MTTRLFSRSRCGCAHAQPRRRRRRRAAFTFIELLVVVLLFVVCSTFVVSCARHQGESYNRVRCASNLRQIGQALLLYSNDNAKAYPRTIASEVKDGQEPIPTWGTGAAAGNPFIDADGPRDNDVTAALFMLLRTQDITSEVFCCPNSSNDEKDVYGGGTNAPINRSNFTNHRKNLSYSFQNPYPRQKAIDAGFKWMNELTADFAVAADKNPGVAGKGDNVLAPTATSSAQQMKLANSNNHDKDGQNILYGDGHVSWESNPFVGVGRDNIYTTADGKITASPVDGNDSILLPTDD